tara:strand:- start:8991 stop:9737 length:747 start_codon:yes stop_codon:yes gene_type:complete
MERMKAYMICDLTNPVSVSYTEVAMKSFEPVSDLIEIIRLQCYKPDTLNQCTAKFSISDISSAKKYQGQNRLIPPAEKACLTSHVDLWFKQADTSERFIIMEHDAYLRDPSKFRSLFSKIDDFEIWNCGIAMECYSITRRFARYGILYWSDPDKQITSGPMGELFFIYTKLHRSRYHLTSGILPVLWPTVYMKNQIVSTKGGDPRTTIRHGKFESAPVTQCYDGTIGSTIDRNQPINKRSNPDVEYLT